MGDVLVVESASGIGAQQQRRRPALARPALEVVAEIVVDVRATTITDVLLDVMQLVACAQRRVGGEVDERKRREAEQLRELLVGARAPG